MATRESSGTRWLYGFTNVLFEMGQGVLTVSLQEVMIRMIKENRSSEQIQQEIIGTITINWARRHGLFSDYGVSVHEQEAEQFITEKVDEFINSKEGFSWKNPFHLDELSKVVWSEVADYEPKDLQDERAKESSVRRFLRRRLGI